jgi:trimeric autotransporter adhesin
MALNRIHTHLGRLFAVWIAVAGLMAAEHHGTIKFGGLPVPGATVTATKGDQKLFTTTDENGRYAFPDLADGAWTIEVEMLGFAKLSNEVGIAFDAPSPEWNLQFLPMSAIMKPPAAAPAAASAATPAKPADPAAAPASVTPATVTAPAVTQAAAAPAAAKPAAGGSAARGQRANAGRGQTGTNGRPSLLEAGGFQRVDVNSSGDLAAAPETGMAAGEMADLSNSADPSLLVSGSVSRGLDMPQGNDWFGGPGGRMGGMGGGPGGMNGMNAAGGGDSSGAGAQMAGRGGRGGPGGMAGGGGMPGGGFGGGFGGRGGGGGGRPGGPGAGRGGPMGRAGVASFGNGRRDRRMQYTGNAAFTLDNSAWDARAYSINGQETAKPAYAKARASFMVGGPLKIPKLLDGTKGTFILNYQMARTRNGTSSTQTMPTLLERAGDFSQSVGPLGPVTIFDPLSGSAFPGNVIPANRIDPVSLALLKYYPNPNAPGYKQNYQAPLTTVNNSDNLNSRLNQTIGKKDRLSGGLGYMGSNSTTPNIFNFVDTGTARNITANVMWSHNFTSKVINSLRYNFSRSRNLTSPFFANQENLAAELGITGTSQAPLNWGPPALSFTNYSGLSDGASSLARNQTSGMGDSLIWVHGVHNLTFGMDYRRQQINRASDPNARGQFTFTGASTADLVNGVAAAGTGYDLASFLIGRPDTTALRYGNFGNLYFRTAAYDVYMTDDWRLSQKLSLNFGIRWDYQSPITELYNRMVNLDVAPGYAADPQVLAGQSGPYSGALPASLVRPDRNNISPRIGFAWRPITKGTLVIRGGYGTYYNTSVYNTIANNMAQQAPFATSFTVATTALPLNVPMNQFFSYVAGQNQLTNTYAVDPNYRIGYAQMWQIAVQQDLGHSLVGTVTYNGTKGTNLDQTILPNSAPSGAKANGLPSGYLYEQSNGNSIYHGVSFQLQRRFRNGVSANAIYTHSKAIDNAVQAQNYLDTSAERALSSSSRPDVLNLNWQYSTAVSRGGGMLINGWKGVLLKDWTLTNSISVGSGMPLTPIVGGVRSTTTGTGITGSLRADATGLPVDPSALNLAFAIPAAGLWGNAGRDTITGPTQFSLNGSLGRTFRVTERKSIDLRFDATNALNHVTFGRFNTTIGSNTLGLLSNPSNMRSMTATLRFRF